MNIFKGRTEFKYRIWDLTARKMILPPSKFSSIVGPVWISMDGRRYIEGVFQRHIYMQYLGIFSSEGIYEEHEICEGDILGHGDNYPCVVQWNVEEAKFEAVEYGNEDGVRYHDMSCFNGKGIILGNVFESPDLAHHIN